MQEQKQTPTGYPSEYIGEIGLKNGEKVTIRPILPEDAPRLQSAFARLSAQSIYMRFLETFKELSDKQAYHFANVDYRSHMALVGTISENDEEHIIAVARYAYVVPENPEAAEAAVVVRDDYQNRGLGTKILLRLVAYAREHGIKVFVATVHSSNARIRHFIQLSGYPVKRTMIEPGVWEFRIFLEETSECN